MILRKYNQEDRDEYSSDDEKNKEGE